MVGEEGLAGMPELAAIAEEGECGEESDCSCKYELLGRSRLHKMLSLMCLDRDRCVTRAAVALHLALQLIHEFRHSI